MQQTHRRARRRPMAFLAALGLGASVLSVSTPTADAAPAQSVGSADSRSFQRVSTFPVYTNLDADEDPTTETSSEIISATSDGRTLVYSDAVAERIGFIDIADPANPVPAGTMSFDGEPTSASVWRNWLLVAVDTSDSLTDPSGTLYVIDPDDRSIAATFDLGGQPDSIGVNAGSRYGAVVIENQRDEDITVNGVEGGLPQLPPGALIAIHMQGDPSDWTLETVELTGFAALAPDDPEPEFVDVNGDGQAVVTFQENNHIVVVDLEKAEVTRSFPAGSTSLDLVDVEEDDVIDPTGSLADVPREPDAVAWIADNFIATANEGDLFGGSRGFSVYDVRSGEVYDSGNSFEHLGISIGHYPEGRSENKGVEPEGIEFGSFRHAGELLFVGSERGNYVGVYRVESRPNPRLFQVLPTGVGPEGLLAIPGRNLLVVASEVDNADDKIRSLVTIYELVKGKPAYPTIASGPAASGAPIGWGALSALVGDPTNPNTLYAIHDSAYAEPRIYTIDTSRKPPRIAEELEIDVPAGFRLDGEGLAIDDDGNFWVASEGRGNAGAGNQTLNQLVKVSPTTGAVLEIVDLPAEVNAQQRSNGFEGVAFHEGGLFVAFQREWAGDPAGQVRIGRYVPASGEWSFALYPLDAVESPAGGWVGLSEITTLGDGTFAIIERDNVPGPDKRIARITTVRLEDESFGPASNPGQLVKSAPYDILPRLNAASQSGWWGDKLEGLAVDARDRVWYATDNDGIDDATGETLFGSLGEVGVLPAAPPAP